MVREVEDFVSDVINADKPVMVEFWAQWCGPCKMMLPVLEQVANENPNIDVVKVNVDNNRELANMENVVAVPTIKMYINGESVKQLNGAAPKARLVKEFEKYL